MRSLQLVAIVLLASSACSKSEKPDKTDSKSGLSNASPDWGNDPRPLGACVGTVKPGVEVPAGSQSSFCIELQTRDECTRPSEHMDYVYTEHHTCASVGFPKRCEGGGYPSSARFKECPSNAKDPSAPAAAASPSP